MQGMPRESRYAIVERTVYCACACTCVRVCVGGLGLEAQPRSHARRRHVAPRLTKPGPRGAELTKLGAAAAGDQEEIKSNQCNTIYNPLGPRAR